MLFSFLEAMGVVLNDGVRWVTQKGHEKRAAGGGRRIEVDEAAESGGGRLRKGSWPAGGFGKGAGS